MYNLITKPRTVLSILTIGAAFQLFGQSIQKDSTFIHKDTINGKLQSIFIDNNKDSEFYNKISHFNFGKFDNDNYKYSTDYLKKNKLALVKTKPTISWTNWVALKQYKGSFYAYHPCDFLFHFKQSINDTTFIDWTGEGPIANKIIEQKKIDNKTYEIRLTGIHDQDRKIIIHIIDRKKGIAVFEQTTNGADKLYYLMIAADKIKNVPIIVNHCPTQKQSELEFDKTDFKSLLITK